MGKRRQIGDKLIGKPGKKHQAKMFEKQREV